MAEDIRKYTFDFVKEAKALQQSLESKDGACLFVEFDSTHPAGDNSTRLQHVVGDQKLKDMYLSGLHDFLNSTFKERRRAEGSVACSLVDNSTGGKIVHALCVKSDHYTNGQFGEKNRHLMRLFALYHEMGHMLNPDGPDVDQDHLLKEGAADAYAALRFFQRFGPDAGKLLSMISWSRANEAVLGDSSHLTTLVLDKIIADSATHDFSKLTSADMIERARTYAEEWTPDPSIVAEARPSFTQGLNIDFDVLFKEIVSPPNNFAFYILAKFSQPFLRRGGLVYNNQTVRLTEDCRKQVKKDLGTHSSGMNLSRMFKIHAVRSVTEPSLIKTLKVTLPSSQRRFVFKP